MAQDPAQDPSQQRDAVVLLVHTDIGQAEVAAAAIPDPWYRAQALAWVARYAPEAAVTRLSQLSLTAAADCDDPYRQAAASAWIIRALMERGRRDEALMMLEVALHCVPRIVPAASRSAALLLLLQAAFHSGEEVRRSLLFALAELHDADPHWRVERDYRDALAMVRTVDPEFARKMAPGRDDAQPDRVADSSADGSREPRAFFW